MNDYEEESAREPVYPAALQTNRAIYAEAAPELYAKTIFAMEFSDIVYDSDRETGHDMEGDQGYGATTPYVAPYVAWAIVMREIYRSPQTK